MNLSDCYYLGAVSKTFGYKGELVITLDVDDPSTYKTLESVFVLINGKLIPFFIDNLVLKPNSNQLTVRFQGIDTEDKARQLLGNELHLPLSLLPPLGEKQFYFHEIEGFTAIDESSGVVGIVEQVLDLPGNPLLQIRSTVHEILVPVRDEFILGLDRESKVIRLRAPEGLIDLYLQDGNPSDL